MIPPTQAATVNDITVKLSKPLYMKLNHQHYSQNVIECTYIHMYVPTFDSEGVEDEQERENKHSSYGLNQSNADYA